VTSKNKVESLSLMVIMRFAFYLLFLVTVNLLGQNPVIYHSSQFERLQINVNSKIDHVYSLAEDDDGFLWIAEQSGLYRFDGDRFTYIKLSKSLGVVRQINPINEDSLLIATTHGMGIINSKSFRVDIHFFTSQNEEYYLEDNFIRWIINGKGNTYWIFTKTSVHLLDGNLKSKGSFTFKKHPDIQSANPTTPICFPMDESRIIMKAFEGANDSLGDIWWCIDIRKGTREVIDLDELAPLEMGTCFQVDPASVIMVSRERPGHPQSFYHYAYANRDLTKLMEYDPSMEWVSSKQHALDPSATGITFFRFKKGFFYDTTLKRITEEYWNFSPYSRYHKMKNGIVYVGNSEGLFRLTPNTLTITKPEALDNYFSTIEFNDGVSDFLKKGKQLYIATHNQHLYRYDSLSHTIENICMPGIASGLVWNLRLQDKDSLWIGTQNGLFVFNTSSGAISRWEKKGVPPKINEVPITIQFEDSHGILWMGLGYGNGLLAYDPERAMVRHYLYDKNHFPLRTATAIAEDRNGNLWMGYENGGGLIYWDRNKDVFTKIKISVESNFTNDRIRSLVVGQDNSLWIGTRHGLFRYDTTTSTFDEFTVNDGLIDDYITKLYFDAYDRVWIGTTNGLSIFEPHRKKFLNLDKNQGLPGSRILNIKAWDASGKKVFVGATNGFCLIDVDDVDLSQTQATLYLEPILVNGTAKPMEFGQRMPLNYKQNNITVTFGIINHQQGRSNTYYYKMSQLDTAWVELKTKGNLVLNGLAPGNYQLQLMTCINGSDCYTEAPLNFHIRPPFWKSIWFFLGMMVLAVLVTRHFYTLRIRNLKKIESIRQQISMDLHDDIGSSISSVRILSDILAAENLVNSKDIEIIQSIREQSGHISDVLEEIIWNVNPKNDTLENVIARMQQYANELLENAQIDCQWNIVLKEGNTLIDAEKRKQLYLFFKEAVNNLAKHSKCEHCSIEISNLSNSLSILIQDDGIGYDTVGNYQSNGIDSMNKRATQLNASLKVLSTLKEGTRIHLKVPL